MEINKKKTEQIIPDTGGVTPEEMIGGVTPEEVIGGVAGRKSGKIWNLGF